MHGAERGWADGQLPKVLFWEQPLLLHVLNRKDIFLCWIRIDLSKTIQAL